MIRIESLSKNYQLAKNKIQVLKHVSLHVKPGELVALMGQSGVGKSTLLNIIGILDTYDRGKYYLQNKLVRGLTENEAAQYKNQLIGFVFQRFYLIPSKTATVQRSTPAALSRNQQTGATKTGIANARTGKVESIPSKSS